MNIFLIPSWYPSQTAPTFGSFTHEQAIATAELVPDVNIIVSTWGHSDSFIDHRSLTNALSALKWRTRPKQRTHQILPNFIEIHTPCLHWSDRLLSTSMPNLINANRKNLESAISQVGDIDLIHAHVSYPGGHIARILAQELSIPYVITEHMGPFPFAQYLRNGQPRSEILTAIGQANATIAVSHSLATKIASFGLPNPTVIPNVVDERRFSLGNPDPSKFVFFYALPDDRSKRH